MADIIKVNTELLHKTTEAITTDLVSIRKDADELKIQIEEMNAMWIGDANKAFNAAFQGDVEALQTMSNNIDEIIVNYEITAKKEYDTCETNVDSLISAIKI